jgi:hypothetical protein
MSVNKKSCLFENSQLGSNSQFIRLQPQPSLMTALGARLSLSRSPITLGPSELLLKQLRTTLSRSRGELAREGEDSYKMAWRIAEKQHPKASMMMIGRSSDVSETSFSKREIDKVIGRFSVKRVRLLHGLFLLPNWHPSVHQEPQTTCRIV